MSTLHKTNAQNSDNFTKKWSQYCHKSTLSPYNSKITATGCVLLNLGDYLSFTIKKSLTNVKFTLATKVRPNALEPHCSFPCPERSHIHACRERPFLQ